jgi:hypothetical protein
MAEKWEGNSTDEIEITREMIEAGVRIFLLGIDEPEAAVESIFLAMLEARHKGTQACHRNILDT